MSQQSANGSLIIFFCNLLVVGLLNSTCYHWMMVTWWYVTLSSMNAGIFWAKH